MNTPSKYPSPLRETVRVTADVRDRLMMRAYARRPRLIEEEMSNVLVEMLDATDPGPLDVLAEAVNKACEARIAFDRVRARLLPGDDPARERTRDAWDHAMRAIDDAIREESRRVLGVGVALNGEDTPVDKPVDAGPFWVVAPRGTGR